MQVYSVVSEKEIISAVHKPFVSEDELEELLYNQQELLGDLKAFARQATSGDGRHIPDLLAVDDDGRVFIGEIKNEHMDLSIAEQIIRYHSWVKKKPLEVKQIWDESKEKDNLTEPDWSNMEIGILLIAPSFSLEGLKAIAEFTKAPTRSLKVQRYQFETVDVIITDYLEETEDMVLKTVGLPKAREKYTIEYYKDWTEDYYPDFLALLDEVETIRDEIGLGWLRRRFNKEYVSYKNGHPNVFEVYIWPDGSPGMGFHLPVPPWDLNIDIPNAAIDETQWDERHRIYYVPIISKKIDVRSLIPLFEQAKQYRGQR